MFSKVDVRDMGSGIWFRFTYPFFGHLSSPFTDDSTGTPIGPPLEQLCNSKNPETL